MNGWRVLLAGFFHETNTFVEQTTGLAEFQILRSDDLVSTRNDGSPLGAVVEFASRCGWNLIPTVDYRAMPGGIVTDEVVEQFWLEFSRRAIPALAEGIDAIYLVLHGAMVAQSCEDVEGEILERLRALPGAASLPIFGVFDLHANFTPRMARLTTGLMTYRENPHTDAAKTAVDAAALLDRCLEIGRMPRTFFLQLPIVWAPTGTGTADSPMADLEKAARRLEQEGHLAVNIIAGFAHADTHDTGVSFTVVTDLSEACAEAALSELAAIALDQCALGVPTEWNLEAALDAIGAARLSGPALLIEPADNIGGGTPGDCTTILRALLKREKFLAGVILNDPEAVRAVEEVSLGQHVRVLLGGKGSRLDPGPVELEIEIVHRSSGAFDLEDELSHLAALTGGRIEMGPCVVARHKSITLLLTSRKTPPMDLGQWRSQGVQPEKLNIINIKAAVSHRRAYDPIAAASYTVATPGPGSSDLKALSYRRLRRPIFPLDALPIRS